MGDNKQPHSEVVTSAKPSKKLKFKLPKLPVLKNDKHLRTNLITAVLILVGVTSLASWSHQQALRSAKLDFMSSVVAGLSPAQKAQYYSDQGEYKLAEKIWNDELSKTKDTQSKLDIYFQQSAIATKYKKYNDAQKYADQAVSLAPKSSDSYVTMALLAKAQGDITSAKKYWQQAIDLLDKNRPGYSLILKDYQASLDALK